MSERDCFRFVSGRGSLVVVSERQRRGEKWRGEERRGEERRGETLYSDQESSNAQLSRLVREGMREFLSHSIRALLYFTL